MSRGARTGKGVYRNYLLLFRSGLGRRQRALVDEGQLILRRNGIDPIYGPENLAWAPNVAGQHRIGPLRGVVERLRQVEASGGGREGLTQALRELGEVAAAR